jgi:hypothetical protein
VLALVVNGKFYLQLLTIPLFTGTIGYITNWSGVIMLFRPIRFHGTRIPGLKFIYPYLPRRVQVIPAISKDGYFGWQGIVPSRVDKMASISCDKALSKVGSISDFYRENPRRSPISWWPRPSGRSTKWWTASSPASTPSSGRTCRRP